MAKKLLALVGLGSIVVFAGVGILAWARVKERVELHLLPSADQADGDRQAILLLRDDVQSLRSDLDQLTTMLEQSLAELSSGLDGRAGARAEELQAALAALEERDARIEARLAALANALAASAGVASLPPPPATEEPAPPPAGEAPAGEAAPERGFLSFRLPSKSLGFDDAQEWALLDGLSRAGFDAKTTLHDYSAATTSVSGSFRTALGHPEAGTSGRITVRAGALDSQEKKRDEDMLGLLDATRFPDLVYEIESFEPREVDATAGKVAGRVLGRMSIKGKTRELAMDVRASLDASKRLLVEGEAPLRLSDYGVEAPSKLGLISMEDEVRIWIALRARSTGRARSEETPAVEGSKDEK